MAREDWTRVGRDEWVLVRDGERVASVLMMRIGGEDRCLWEAGDVRGSCPLPATAMKLAEEALDG